MSQLTPSFHTLYRQSRPPHHTDRSKTMEQHERFATACLAFVLHHDSAFRTDFLKTICDYKEFPVMRDFQVSIEIDKCGDLALIAENVILIIDIKINSGLADKQNPDKGKKFFDDVSGYGRNIIQSFRGKRAYIILWQEESRVANPRDGELRCITKTWKELGDCVLKSKPASLVNDLCHSLGSFRVRCFAILNPMTDKLKLSSKAGDACRVRAVLNDVANYLKEEIGLPWKKENSDIEYMGWDLLRRGADPKWIEFIVESEGNNTAALTWFGYSDQRVQVGFYCAPSKVEKVQRTLKSAAGDFGKVEVYSEDNYVWISSDGSPAEGDKEWFRQIYDRLSDYLGLHPTSKPKL
ncbi:MAG: hypothetical protein JO117_01645 [Verrucomicrobia bacterium]|nr:hypothetical protein [Verrucomicrobiota bacterium]